MSTPARPEPPWEPTERLLERIRAGDERAENILLGRYRPTLVNWARNQLPAHARGLTDTQDLVQLAMLNTFKYLRRFEYRHQGAFHWFLRKVLLNEIRGAIRKARRRPATEPIPVQLVDRGPTPADVLLGADLAAQYEKCLARLSPEQAEAVVLNEMGFSHEEIKEILGLKTANAARMRVARGIVRLSEMMGRSRGRT